METLTHYQFPFRSQYEKSKDLKGLVYSFFFHAIVLACLFFVLNVKTPLEPIVQVFSVALLEEQAAPPPSKPVPEPVQEPKKKEVPPPPPVEEDAISFQKSKKVKKEEPKPFVFKKKNVVLKKRIKKKVPPPPVPPKEEIKEPTLEDELRELELERMERMKKRTPTATKKRVKYATSSVKIDAPEFPFQWYINAVKLQIDKNWSPMAELGPSIKQTIVVFMIGREGQLLDNKVEKSSGIPEFDLAALRAIANSDFPPLPVGFNEPTLQIHIGFIHEPE